MIGEVVAGRYRLEKLLGTGGMSSVFQAYDALLERTVALKILHAHYSHDADYVERFRREARAAAQLSHPNIVTVIDRGEHDGRQFIVFEHVPGETLKKLVAERGRLPVRQALEIALQVARALAFAHRRGLVHRDVKPQNVLMYDGGQAKVTDFGIARSIDVQGLTQTGTVLGTSDYIAPEQASGEPVDVQSDVYSLGVVLYELLTGEVPFSGDNFVAVALRHVNDPPPSVLDRRPDVPLRLDAALRRAMAKDRSERFPSMDDLTAELEACLAEIGPEPDRDATMIIPPSTRAGRPRGRGGVPRRRRRLLRGLVAGALAIGALAALAAGAVALLRGSDSGSADDAPRATQLRLVGLAAHDPHGTGGEHDELVARATDGDVSTYWTTERYTAGLQKPGVGVVLDSGRHSEFRHVTLVTDTPGFVAEIQAGSSAGGPFPRVSDARTVSRTTRFPLEEGASGRYLVVWITELGGAAASAAHVNEVRAG